MTTFVQFSRFMNHTACMCIHSLRALQYNSHTISKMCVRACRWIARVCRRDAGMYKQLDRYCMLIIRVHYIVDKNQRSYFVSYSRSHKFGLFGLISNLNHALLSTPTCVLFRVLWLNI